MLCQHRNQRAVGGCCQDQHGSHTGFGRRIATVLFTFTLYELERTNPSHFALESKWNRIFCNADQRRRGSSCVCERGG